MRWKSAALMVTVSCARAVQAVKDKASAASTAEANWRMTNDERISGFIGQAFKL